VARSWTPGDKYEIELRGIRNVSGVVGDAKGVLTVPKPTAPDSTGRATDGGADSLKKRRPPKKKP
jgi:hypothetical protein